MRHRAIALLFAALGAAACSGEEPEPLTEAPLGPPAGSTELEWGEQLFETQGCVACHRIDGGASVGPSLNTMIGRPRTMTDGREVMADADYVRQSLLEPEAALVAGYEPVMPTYEGLLEPPELDALILYLQSLTVTHR